MIKSLEIGDVVLTKNHPVLDYVGVCGGRVIEICYIEGSYDTLVTLSFDEFYPEVSLNGWMCCIEGEIIYNCWRVRSSEIVRILNKDIIKNKSYEELFI